MDKKDVMKLSKAQKEVIERIRKGERLFENKITPGARFQFANGNHGGNWGNVNGNVIAKLIKGEIIVGSRLHIGAFEYHLTKLGKTIEL